jgi:endonuclease/exonuclease/phosphatase family metal-dependent hydrolase
VRLATWNVHNLFDAIDNRNDDLVPSQKQVDKKLANLSLALNRMEADVLALQEVENLSILQRLARSSGYRYAILVEGNDTRRGIDVALLSKLKVAGYASHKRDRLPYVEGAGLDTQFSRDCLEVHLATPDPLVLLVNHFKSKVGKGKSSDAKRRSQALRVAQMVQDIGQRYPASAVVVLGDLNDCMESWPLEPLARSGLLDPFARLTPEQRHTHKYRGQGTALDQILIDRRLQSRLRAGSPEVGNHKEFRRCSDHRPMWLDFDL